MCCKILFIYGFKGAWTLKINCNKHWLNKIYFVVKKSIFLPATFQKIKT